MWVNTKSMCEGTGRSGRLAALHDTWVVWISDAFSIFLRASDDFFLFFILVLFVYFLLYLLLWKLQLCLFKYCTELLLLQFSLFYLLLLFQLLLQLLLLLCSAALERIYFWLRFNCCACHCCWFCCCSLGISQNNFCWTTTTTEYCPKTLSLAAYWQQQCRRRGVLSSWVLGQTIKIIILFTYNFSLGCLV